MAHQYHKGLHCLLFAAIVSMLTPINCTADAYVEKSAQSAISTYQARSKLEVGINMLKKKQWEAAIQHFDSAHHQDPTNMLIIEYRAAAWIGLGKWDEAINDYTQVIQSNQLNCVAYFNRAKAYLAAGENDKAISDLDSNLALVSTNAQAYKLRALILSSQRKLPEAIHDWTQGLIFEPNDALALTSRGKDYSDLGEWSKAVRDYEKAVQLDPTSDRAQNNLAWLLATSPDAELRDGKRAVAAATRACGLTKWERWDWIETLAAAYAETGNFKEAVRYQIQAIKCVGTNKVHLVELRSQLLQYEQGHPCRIPSNPVGEEKANAEIPK